MIESTFSREYTKAFENAVSKGVFSIDPNKPNYHGPYMYMYTKADVTKLGFEDYFKHQDTRQYLKVKVTP